MTVKLRLLYFVNQSQEEDVRCLVQDELGLFPYWVNRITVSQCSPGEGAVEGAALSVVSNDDYRFVCISVFDGFFSETEKDRRRMLRHELIHVYLAPMVDWVKEEMIPYVKTRNDDLGACVEREFGHRLESTTESLAILFDKVRNNKEPNAKT